MDRKQARYLQRQRRTDGQKDRRTSRHAPEYKDRTSGEREKLTAREREREKKTRKIKRCRWTDIFDDDYIDKRNHRERKKERARQSKNRVRVTVSRDSSCI